MGSSKSKQSDNQSALPPTQGLVNPLPTNIDHNRVNANSNWEPASIPLRSAMPLVMPTLMTFQCNHCGMVFPSDESLYKHKTRFCLGNKDSSVRRTTHYLDNELLGDYATTNNLTNLPPIKSSSYQSPLDKKREELKDWKNQRSILQNVQDMEDRILLDSEKTQKLARDLKRRSDDYTRILAEYEQLQTKERQLLRQMFNLQDQSRTNLSPVLTSREQDQLNDLNRQNMRLQQERRIIKNKLEDLIATNHQPSIPNNYDPYRLLRQMKEQQELNERNLMLLQKRFQYTKGSLINPIDHSYLPSSNRQATSEEIRDLRNEYLRLGGHDANVLARYSDLERRLYRNDYYSPVKDYSSPLTYYPYHPVYPVDIKMNETSTPNFEKQELQYELDSMQKKFQTLDSRTRQLEYALASNGLLSGKPPTNNGGFASPLLDRYQPRNNGFITSARPIPKNIDNDPLNARQNPYYSSLPAFDGPTTHRGAPSANHAIANTTRYRSPFEPQPYDANAGFVIFFDYIMHLHSSIDQCRLITCLCHAQSGLGQPSPLETFKCQLYLDERTGERINIVSLATRQPVPKCPPQQALSIIIEVLTTTKQNSNEPLRTNAWTKVPLFDNKRRLLNGRWKLPLRTLPIKHDESFAVINTLPVFGHAELYYRLVNAEDATAIGGAPLSVVYRDRYLYPPED